MGVVIMSEKKYWKPPLSIKLKDEITSLFSDVPSIKNQYDNNPVDFARESIRLQIQKIRREHIITDDIKKALVDEILDRLKD